MNIEAFFWDSYMETDAIADGVVLEFLQLLVHSNVILLMDFQMRRINI